MFDLWHMSPRNALLAGLAMVQISILSATHLSAQNLAEEPLLGRWTEAGGKASIDRPLPVGTIDFVPCGPRTCAFQVGTDGTCGAILMTIHDKAQPIAGAGGKPATTYFGILTWQHKPANFRARLEDGTLFIAAYAQRDPAMTRRMHAYSGRFTRAGPAKCLPHTS